MQKKKIIVTVMLDSDHPCLRHVLDYDDCTFGRLNIDFQYIHYLLQFRKFPKLAKWRKSNYGVVCSFNKHVNHFDYTSTSYETR